MKPLRDGLQSLTSQKDALLAEKTALKNEVWLIKLGSVSSEATVQW